MLCDGEQSKQRKACLLGWWPWFQGDKHLQSLLETVDSWRCSPHRDSSYAMVRSEAVIVVGYRYYGLLVSLHLTNTLYSVEAQGLLWIVSAWTGAYPNEANSDFVYVYDPASDSWSTRTPMPLNRRRGGSAVVVVGDRIYVSHGNYGGHEVVGGGDTATSVGWIDYYDIATDSWTALPNSAPNPRDHTGGALIGNSICVAGGRDGGYCATWNDCWPSVEPTDCFDLATETWSVKANIPQKRAGSSYGTTCDGKLMVAGGEGEGQAWKQVDVFDGNSWETIDDLVVQRHGSGLAMDCECEQIHIASGCSAPGGTPEIKSVETFFYSGVDTTCDPGPTTAPTIAPTSAPVVTTSPTTAPILPPTTPAPTLAPVETPTEAPVTFSDILINVGGNDYTEIGGAGRTWIKDTYATGGITYNDSQDDILGTIEDTLYHSERYGPSFSYEIPVPTASYEVTLLFAEIYWTEVGKRTFNLNVEGETRDNIDIVDLAGAPVTAMTLEYAVIVQDGSLSISLTESTPKNDLAKLSGIQVKLVGPHLAHAGTFRHDFHLFCRLLDWEFLELTHNFSLSRAFDSYVWAIRCRG